MSDLHHKFIILDDTLIISKVAYHKDILCGQVDPVAEKERIKGGGWFRFSNKSNTFTFYGDSHDFGAAKLEDIKKAIDDAKVFTNVYETVNITNKHNYSYDTGSEIIELAKVSSTITE